MLAKKIPILILAALLFAAPAFAHHLWVENSDGYYEVNRGIISERTDAYDPTCVKEIKAYTEDGAESRIERINKNSRVVFKTKASPALVSVASKWGARVNTTRGKKQMSRKEAENAGLTVISAFSSTQFSKTLFKPSSLSQKPLGIKFEIVPLNPVMAATPARPVAFMLLFEGKPLDNAAIYTHDEREIKTDENGVARIAFAEKGVQLLYAGHQTPPETNTELDYLKFMTFLIFEVK